MEDKQSGSMSMPENINVKAKVAPEVKAFYNQAGEDYEGFWESRGYSNDGNLNKGFYDPLIPEFPSWIVLPLLIAIATLAFIIYRKRLTKKMLH